MTPRDCLSIWTEKNNHIVNKYKCSERNNKINGHDVRQQYYCEMCSLLRKIKGVPCVSTSVELELTVLYNAVLLTLSLSKFSEAGDLLTQGIIRALEAFGCQPHSSDLLVLWPEVLEKFQAPKLLPTAQRLLCVQWALWLSTQQLDNIQKLFLLDPQGEITSLSPIIRNIELCPEEDPSLLVMMTLKELKELVHICTVVTQGVGKMKEGLESEALQVFRKAAMMPAPRSLLAEIHMLSGICLARLGKPQSSLQCYRRALEVDFGCRRALYQSSLIYRQLENAPAEIDTLRLLCVATQVPSSGGLSRTLAPLITQDTLFCGLTREQAFVTPSLLEIQHALAHRCLQCGRVSEAAENYLELLASFQADLKQLVTAEASSNLPRVPDVYLEAAVTMLKAKRYWDSVSICEEVITKTVDLIPDRLVLELALPGPGSSVSTSPDTRELCGRSGRVEERLNYVLWAGAAFLIEGQAYSWLKDSKEAVTALTRSINLLVKVRLKNEEWQLQDPGDPGSTGGKVQTLQRLKALALACRGVEFMDREQEGAALQDFQLSLHASPGVEAVELWLIQALWKLGREEEATIFWKSIQRASSMPEPGPHSSGTSLLLLHLQSYLQEKMLPDAERLRKMKLSTEAPK